MLKIPLSTCFRVMYENQFCWMDQGNSVYFLAVPSILTILINIFFLVSVVKVIRSHSHFLVSKEQLASQVEVAFREQLQPQPHRPDDEVGKGGDKPSSFNYSSVI